MKTTIETNGKKYEVTYPSILPSGYGHKKVSLTFFDENGNRHDHSIITSNMRLIDSIKSDDDNESEEAIASISESIIDNYYVTI